MRLLVASTALMLSVLTDAGPPAGAPARAPPPVPHTTLSPGLTAVPLTRGCTNVALTYPDGAAIADSYHATLPMSAPAGDVWTATPILESVWRYGAATRRFLAWSPAPDAPNDFTTVKRLDAVSLCARAAGRLVQPMSG